MANLHTSIEEPDPRRANQGAAVGAKRPCASWQSPEALAAVRAAHTARDEALLPLREVLRRTGWSRSTLYRRVAAGRFPAPIRGSGWRLGFAASEVDAVIEAWKRERDEALIAT